jgi:hypothetical protein
VSETVASENLGSENLASENIASENLASENLASENLARENLVSKNIANFSRATCKLAQYVTTKTVTYIIHLLHCDKDALNAQSLTIYSNFKKVNLWTLKSKGTLINSFFAQAGEKTLKLSFVNNLI